jgi:cytochrome c biogenesis protein CcdA
MISPSAPVSKSQAFQSFRWRIEGAAHGTRLATKPQRDGRLCLYGTAFVTNLVRDAILLGYAATVGFVAAGVIASFYKWMTSEPARFVLLGQGSFALVTSFAFFALTGPVIIVEQLLRMYRTKQGPAGGLVVGVLIAALWSCCSGIVVLSVVLSLRHNIA